MLTSILIFLFFEIVTIANLANYCSEDYQNYVLKLCYNIITVRTR